MVILYSTVDGREWFDGTAWMTETKDAAEGYNYYMIFGRLISRWFGLVRSGTLIPLANLPPVSAIPMVHLELRIFPRIFEKNSKRP